MCGRTTSTPPRDRLARLLDVDRVDTPELPLRWNAAPTQSVYAVIADREAPARLALFAGDWSLIGPPTCESVTAHKRSRRNCCSAPRVPRRHQGTAGRCSFSRGSTSGAGRGPARKGGAARSKLYPASSQPVAFAGPWDRYDAEGRALSTCAIVTTAANPTMAPVQHRMPVVLSSDTWDEWLRPLQLRPTGLHRLLQPAPQDVLNCHIVSTSVNSTRNAGPGLVAPIPPGLTPLASSYSSWTLPSGCPLSERWSRVSKPNPLLEAFPVSYIPSGLTKKDQVRLAGNAVTPPVMTWLMARVTRALEEAS